MAENNGKHNIVILSEKGENSCGKKIFWKINKEMLPYKIHFFLFIGGLGAMLPFQSALGITKLGLTPSNIAAVFTAQQVLVVLMKPGIGYVTDYFNGLKATMVGLTVLVVTFSLFLIIIPNSGMPGVKTMYASNVSHAEFQMCNMCTYEEDFMFSLQKQELEEDKVRKVFSCFQRVKKENLLLKCANGGFDSATYFNEKIVIVHTHCKSSNTGHKQSKNYSSLEDITNVFLVRLTFNNTQQYVICILPKTLSHNENFSYSVQEHCYTYSNTKHIALEELLVPPSIGKINCNKQDASDLVSREDHNAALTSANFGTYQFWLYAVILIVSCTCDSSLFTISDTACYESVHGVDYGRQRAWGAISWGLVSPFAGFLIDYTSSYFAAWCLMLFLCSLQIWNLSRMNLVKPDFSQNLFKDIKTVFRSMEFLAFEAGVFMNGFFAGIIWFYLPWFLLGIGGNKLVIGLSNTFQCYLGEVPALFLSQWLIKKLGHFNLVSIAIFCHGIRFFVYSYLYNPWYVLPIECLHGLTFGSFYSAMTSYGKLNSKPGTEATTQSVLCTTYDSLGAGAGCLVAGICIDLYGSHVTFFYAAFLCAAGTGINVISTLFTSCRKKTLNINQVSIAVSKRY